MKGKGGLMKTVKEVSELTGISIRTLRYYDEIDLLKPAKVTEAGYRLYDESSLKKLRQIMFFRELEVPLSEIKAIMKDSESDNRKILETQKMMLEMKRNRFVSEMDNFTVSEFDNMTLHELDFITIT